MIHEGISCQDSGSNLGLFMVVWHCSPCALTFGSKMLCHSSHNPPAAANPATPWVAGRVARPAPRNPRAVVVRPMTNNKQRKRTSNIRPGHFRKFQWVGSWFLLWDLGCDHCFCGITRCVNVCICVSCYTVIYNVHCCRRRRHHHHHHHHHNHHHSHHHIVVLMCIMCMTLIIFIMSLCNDSSSLNWNNSVVHDHDAVCWCVLRDNILQ